MLKLLFLGATAAAAFVGGWTVKTWQVGEGQTRTVTKIVRVVERQAAQTQAIAVESAKAQAEIRYVTKTLIKEVPVHVSPEVDRRYPLPVGLVRLHDASVLGLPLDAVPDPAGRPDDAASDVKASDAAVIFAENNGNCRADRERLASLQAWVRAMAEDG